MSDIHAGGSGEVRRHRHGGQQGARRPDRVLRPHRVRGRRPHHVEPLLRRRNRGLPAAHVGVARLRQSRRRCRAEAGRDRPRPRLRRRHRRAAFGERVGPTGKVYGLDMTDEMLALARENQRKAGATNVEFLKGHDRSDSAAGQLRRRDHLELRDQSVERQGRRAARGVPRAEAGRPVRRLRRRRPRRRARRRAKEHGAVGRLRRRRARGDEYAAKLKRRIR